MQTLRVMAVLARNAAVNELFRQDLASVISGEVLTGGDLSALDLLIRGHFRYRPELEEVVRTPELMLHEWIWRGYFEGDCDDASTMLGAIFSSLGIPSRFVAIRYDDKPDFEHVFVEAYDASQGRWGVFDPTVDVGTVYNETERMVEPL